MAWPNKEHLANQNKLFFDGGGAEFVREQMEGMDSIGKHKETGEPWPIFHRCHICGQHPESMGDRALKVGPRGNWHLCEYCVTQMYKVMKGEE